MKGKKVLIYFYSFSVAASLCLHSYYNKQRKGSERQQKVSCGVVHMISIRSKLCLGLVWCVSC